MDYKNLPAGRNVPTSVYALIEIAKDQGRVKYEFDRASGAIIVDRLRPDGVQPYPVNYGCVPQTLSDDGDPLDILVLCDPIQTGTVVPVRPIGVLVMEDEKGLDVKIIAVPSADVSVEYNHIQSLADLPPRLKFEIEYFFTHYKDLETGKGKFSRVSGWEDVQRAHKYITDSIANAQAAAAKKGNNGNPPPAP